MEYDGRAKRGYEALCARYKLASDLIDAAALWDNTLTYGENISRLEEEVKKISPERPEADKLSNKQVKAEAKAAEHDAFCRFQEEKQKYLEDLFNGTKERTGEGAEILSEVQKFNPHCVRMTLSTLMAVNQGTNVINMSPAGYGKSRATIELLNLLGIPYTEVTGHKAPTDFFNLLRDAKGLVTIDESATLLKNPEILNLLLGALWGGKVCWRDEEARVTATIIFNTNSLPKSAFVEALKDRCQFNTLRLDSERIKDKLLSSFDYLPDSAMWDKVRNNAFVKTELTAAEIEKIKQTLKAIAPKSVRDKGRLLAQARFCKALFGTVDYVKLFVDVDAVSAILASDLGRAEKVKAIADQEGVSVRTAQRWVKDGESE